MLNPPVLLRRQSASLRLRTLCFTSGIVAGLLISAVLLMAVGVPADAIVNEFIVQVFFTERGLAQTATMATPLILVGLGASAALHLRFWNIGMEGQLWCGALAATGVAIYDIGPEPIRIVVILAAGFAGGSLWIALPVFLKLRYRVNEIIMTLLMIYVAYLLVQHMLFGAWQDPATSFPVSPPFDPFETLPELGWGHTQAGLFIALGAGAFLWLLMSRSRFGYYANVVGHNADVARVAGLPVATTVILAVLLSGGLSGLAGAVIVAGDEHRLTLFLGEGYTFSAIVIAFIAGSRPIPTVIAAFAVAGVYAAGETLKVFYSISEAVVILVEGTILFCLLISRFFCTFEISSSRRPASP